MHTVELRAHALDALQRLGYKIRQDWLGGSGGGVCELKGHKILFLDLTQGPAEQLDQALDALRREPEAARLPAPPELRDLLKARKCA